VSVAYFWFYYSILLKPVLYETINDLVKNIKFLQLVVSFYMQFISYNAIVN